MLPIQSFDPSATPTGGKIPLNASDPGAKILFYNESDNNIVLDFLNGNKDTLHAWEARWWLLDGNTDEIDWTIDSTLTGSGQPISKMMGTLYGPNEELPGTYPVQLIRQTNVGNPLTIGQTTSLVNTGNNAGTSIIIAQPTGDSQFPVQMFNSGGLILGDSVNHGEIDLFATNGQELVLTGLTLAMSHGPSQFFVVDSGGNITAVGSIVNGGKGQLQIGQVAAGDTIGTDPAGDLFLKSIASVSPNISFQPVSGTTSFHVATTGPVLDANTTLTLLTGSISRISKFTANVSTTPTLFNHGLGAVPDIVLLSINGTSSTAASVQYDTATLSNTQVKLTGSAALSVTGLAIKF